MSDPALLTIIGQQHTYKLAASLSTMRTISAEKPGAATIYYDIEHWASTPLSEQQHPVASVASASKIAHAAGKLFGVTPDGRFLGISPSSCSFNVNNGIVPGVNWKQVDAVNFQDQMLASDYRCGSGNVKNYAAFLKQVVAIIRAQNPHIVISSQVSLRDSAPKTAIAAANSVFGLANAIYVAYPSTNCAACTPANLATVLTALKN